MTKTLSLERYSKQDIRLAKARCSRILNRYNLVLAELAPTCLLSVVIPVYDEQVSRLKHQIEAFNRQDIDPNLVELVYIVNNPKRSKVTPSVLKNNDEALSYLKKAKSNIRIVLIDRSSAKHELIDGNVGEARNVADHAVTRRYLDQNRDGIILQTDADSFPIKKNLFKEIVRELPQKNCVGASGGVRFVLSLDSKKKSEQAFYVKHLKAFNQYMQWSYLLRALRYPKLKPIVTPTRFSGANSVTLAIAAICAGGVPSLVGGSDYVFGLYMETYAKKRGYVILPRRDEWIMSTSFRESRRTKFSFGGSFQTMKSSNGVPLVQSRHSPDYKTFLSAKLRDLDALLLESQDAKEKRQVKKLVDELRKTKGHAAKLAHTFERCTKDKTKTLTSFFNRLRMKQYPFVPLSSKEFAALKKDVYRDPRRKAYAENAIKYFATFHLN